MTHALAGKDLPVAALTAMDRLIVGISGECEVDDVCYQTGASHWWWDTYDSSIELIAMPLGWLPSEDQYTAFNRLGVDKIYISQGETAVVTHVRTRAVSPCTPRNSGSDSRGLIGQLRARVAELEALLALARSTGGGR